MKYLLPFIIAFGLTVFMNFLAIKFSKNISFQNRRSKRHIHNKNISRMGGLIFATVFIAVIFLDRNLFVTPELYGFLLGIGIILIFGLWDDIKEIFWKIQLFFQVAVSVLVFILGIRIYYITNPLTGGILKLDSGIAVIFSVALVIFWIVLVINAINWSDGIDGLSGGITFITAMTIFFLSFRPEVYQPPIAIMCAILMGVILGFLIFNFYPSQILAGTVGSMFMGFSLAVLAIFAGTKIATALLVLSIPIIDFLWVITERIRSGKSIFKSDRNHLHYKLMELGWSQRKVVLVYWLITATISFIALNTRIIGKGVTMLVVVVSMIIILLMINKKIASLKENEK